MSKTLSQGLLAHYRSPVQTITRCVKIERQDGVVLGLTELDRPLVFENIYYHSAAGYTSTAVQTSSQLAVGTVEIEGILSVIGVTAAQIAEGVFDHARIEIFEVNYEDFSQGKLSLLHGYWGETRVQGGRYTTEFRSLAHRLQQPFGQYYTPTCRAQLGDARCQASLDKYTECDKQLSTCREKFNNVLNFRGEPFVPGQERMLRYPDMK